MNKYELWSVSWSPKDHNTDYAKKRIKSAKSAKLTPVKINDDGTGVFAGSGKKPYNVSLDKCTCIDFARNNKPCKHIYRLAIELGVLDENASVYKTGKALPWSGVADIVEELSDSAQITFIDLIRKAKKGEPISKRKKKCDEIIEMRDLGILDIVSETPQFYTILIPEDYTQEIYKVYQYFNRKFYPPSELELNDELEEVYKPLSNDDRTERLLEKGFAVKTDHGVFIKSTL